MSKIRVLVVDDSATMRGLLTSILSHDPDIEVVGAADNPLEAREAIKALNPDVLTLDIEMPNMNGLEFLEKIMRLRPMPVVMVSSLTQKGAEASVAALELGAFECIGKPTHGGSTSEAFAGLVETVKAAARANVRAFRDAPTPKLNTGPFAHDKIIAIGASTGGVEALLAVLSTFPANCPPTVITQHMPANFTTSFAQRLNRSCAATVEEATDGAQLAPGRIYLAPGGGQHLEVVGQGQLRCKLKYTDHVNGHRPSVDVLFESVASLSKVRAVGAILTGMGRDGAKGLLAMRNAGAETVGQDAASCIVYGMPKAAFELGAVERQMPLEKIGPAILNLCSQDIRVRA